MVALRSVLPTCGFSLSRPRRSGTIDPVSARKGKRVALAAAGLGTAVILAAAWAAREDVVWWWRTRDAAAVWVEDFVSGNHRLEGPAMVVHARDATRRFIGSLSAKPPANVVIVGYWSRATFVPPRQLTEMPFLVELVYLRGEDDGEVECRGVRYACTLSEWRGYLRDLLGPVAPAIIAAWSDPATDPEERFSQAIALALVAPGTPGLVESFRDAVAADEGDRGTVASLFWSIRCLGEIGPAAAVAVPAVAAAIERTEHEEIRAAGMEALRRIRGSLAPEAPPQ
jgi:hypothetical protein